MGMQMSLVRVPAEAAFRLPEAPEEVEGFRSWNVPDRLDLDKAWAGIDFLLAKVEGIGTSFLFAGGTPVGDPEAFDFELPRLLLPEEVDAAAHLLREISVDRLREAYDPAAMTTKRIYPDVIWERDGDEAFDFLAGNYGRLEAFVVAASSSGDALLIELG